MSETRPRLKGDEDREETGFYDSYVDFARNLRTWFLAYGIGAPVLFVSNEAAWTAIKESGLGAWVAYLFLGGVMLQVLAALMYKTAMWFLYMGELQAALKDRKRYRVAERISTNYVLEAGIDAATVGLFGVATIIVLKSLLT